jgi:hypothetical protein
MFIVVAFLIGQFQDVRRAHWRIFSRRPSMYRARNAASKATGCCCASIIRPTRSRLPNTS